MDKFITDEKIAAQGGLERPGPFGVEWGRWEGPWKLMFPRKLPHHWSRFAKSTGTQGAC